MSRLFSDRKTAESIKTDLFDDVRYLSGPRHGNIKAYFAAHPEVADYDKGYGFSVQHDRGKRPIAEVIEW